MGTRKRQINRRQFLKGSAAAGAMAALSAPLAASASEDGLGWFAPHADIEEISIVELQAMMEAGTLTSRQLTGMYLERIRHLDQDGPKLNSFIETSKESLRIADQMDAERRAGNVRGPLHGIPIALKDNIDTVDDLKTAAGSLALVDSMPLQDATVASNLREAGAILLGKLGLSEWANFRGNQSSSGWSGRGGQVRNPYIIDRSPCGSSSGSGTAPSANLVTAALGTETNGSIVCPSNNCGLAGIKPTVGLTSRAGVVPISHTQDTIGPMARSVADAAAVLSAIVGQDDRDEATAEARNISNDYTQFLNPEGLSGARIGIARSLFGFSPETDNVINGALQAISDAGATLIDKVEFPDIDMKAAGDASFQVMLYELKWDLEAYLAGRTDNSPKTLADLIKFNEEHANEELQWFGQELFYQAQEKGPLTDADYLEALKASRDVSRASLDAALDGQELDAIVAPTGSPAWPIDLINGDHFLGGSSSMAARAGYPLISVPAGFIHGLPIGITFMGRQWDESRLITLASGFEAVTKARRKPEYLPTLAY